MHPERREDHMQHIHLVWEDEIERARARPFKSSPCIKINL